MNELPFLIFDEELCVWKASGFEWLFPEILTEEETGALFLRSLRSGDRRRFREYCASPLPEEPDEGFVSCEMLPLSGLPVFRYAFCEKNRSGGRWYTTVFLAEDAGRFRPLISPASLSYSRTTERIIREILLLSGEPSLPSDALTPGTILALRAFPTLLHSLMAPGRGSGLCDVQRITETVVKNLSETPLFLHTVFELCPADTVPARRIIELSADLYVHILTAILTALMALSADHTITLDVQPFAHTFGNAPLAVNVTVSTMVREAEPFRSACGSLRSLALPGSVSDPMLTLASVLTCLAGIETSIRADYNTPKLNICLTINPESNRQIPGFKYRDPYRTAGAVITEFFSFYHSL